MIEINKVVDNELPSMSLYGYIGIYGSYYDVMILQNFLREHKNKDVLLYIDSEGGSVNRAMAMGNLIQTHGRVASVVIGAASSAAAVIAVACAETLMYKGTNFLFHKSWVYTVGNSDVLQETADHLNEYPDAWMKSVVRARLERGGKVENIEEEVSNIFQKYDVIIGASEAFKKGLCDEIRVL